MSEFQNPSSPPRTSDESADSIPNGSDDAALDLFLAEVNGGPSPPDLQRQILSRFHAEQSSSAKSTEAVGIVDQILRPNLLDRRSSRSRFGGRRVLSVLAGVAAVLLLGLGVAWKFRQDHSAAVINSQSNADVIADISTPSRPLVPPTVPPIKLAESAVASSTVAAPNKIIELDPSADEIVASLDIETGALTEQKTRTVAGQNIANDDPSSGVVSVDSLADGPAFERELLLTPSRFNDLNLVQSQMNSLLKKYWKSAGVTPTGYVDRTVLLDRLQVLANIPPSRFLSSRTKDLMSVAIGEQPIDANRLHREFTDSSIARALSERWLKTIFNIDGNDKLTEQKNFTAMVDEFAVAIGDDRPVDHLVAEWIADSGNAIHGLPNRNGSNSADVARIAQLTLDADVRCSRCHDDRSGRHVSLSNYWSLAAVLQPHDDDLFFETPDSRQQMANPVLPSIWTESPNEVSDRDSFAASRIGSQRLAAGLVDSIWTMVHGRPLSPSIIDFDTVSDDDQLRKLRSSLVDDLVSSGFQIRRTFAVVFASPVLLLSTANETQQAFDAKARELSKRQIETFAAFDPSSTSSSGPSQSDRVAYHQSISSDSLSTGGPELLAQIDYGSDKYSRPRSDDSFADQLQTLFWDYPIESDTIQPTWLLSISDPQQQSQHLAYLDGRDELPKPIQMADDQMRRGDVSDGLRLQRLWWLMR